MRGLAILVAAWSPIPAATKHYCSDERCSFRCHSDSKSCWHSDKCRGVGPACLPNATKYVKPKANATVARRHDNHNHTKSPDGRPPYRTWWVHTPKTGSSFCLTLQHEWCRKTWPPANGSELYDLRGCSHAKGFTCGVEGVGHGPVPSSWDTSRAVIVLRDPFERILSSFSNSMHHHGMSLNYWDKHFRPWIADEGHRACARVDARDRDGKERCQRLAEFEAYANATALKACVTKTLTGRWCADEFANATAADADRAVARLATFEFVGIFEDWNVMVESFHALLGYGKETLGPFDFAHLRSTQRVKFPDVPASFRRSWADPLDQAIYDAGLRLYCDRFRVADAAPFDRCAAAAPAPRYVARSPLTGRPEVFLSAPRSF